MKLRRLLPVVLVVEFVFAAGYSQNNYVVSQTNISSKCDLTSLHISYDPDPVYVSDKVAFAYSINNIGMGPAPAKSYRIDLYLDDKRISGDWATEALEGGGSNEYWMGEGFWNWVATNAGIHTYRLVITPSNTLHEANDANNIVSGKLVVLENPPPDRKVDSTATRPREVKKKATALNEADYILRQCFPGRDLPDRIRIVETTNEYIIIYPQLLPPEQIGTNRCTEIRIHKTDAKTRVTWDAKLDSRPAGGECLIERKSSD